jgi:glycosyltransferase involved in cell wall biosynthesis
MIDELHHVFPNMTIAFSDHGMERAFFNTHQTGFAPQDAVSLPKIVSLANGLLQPGACRRAMRTVEERSDILLVQLPFDSPLALFGNKRPTLYHACADLRSVARSSRFRGPARMGAYLATRSIDGLYSHLINARSARLIANGKELFEKYGTPRGKWAVSSAISEKEIASIKRMRPQTAAFRVLYVGYVRRWKGLDLLIDAFDGLLKEIPYAELHIVGQADLNEAEAAGELGMQIQKVGRQAEIKVLGHIPFGPELFHCFADADVLTLPSRGVEGTPRVLIEARAFGCPVLATDVGGVRSSITHEVDGLIVPPNDAEALRRSLLRLARDSELRRRLSENGLKRASSCTVEAFAAGIAEELLALTGDHSKSL